MRPTGKAWLQAGPEDGSGGRVRRTGPEDEWGWYDGMIGAIDVEDHDSRSPRTDGQASRVGRDSGANRASPRSEPVVGGLPTLMATAIATLGAAGCAVGPDYLAPEPPLPDAWHLELTEGLEAGESDLRTWWTALGDPRLDALMERATGNLDLRQAFARVVEARARRGVARGQWFPDLSAGAGWQAQQVPEDLGNFLGGDRTFSTSNVGLDASWEIDVFGRIRRSTESADADLMARVEDYRDVLVVLYADVAASYVEVRTLQARIRYARDNAETQSGSLQLTVDRNRAGLAADLDVRQAELNLAQTESAIPLFQALLAQEIHRLGVLLGLEPSALFVELSDPVDIPAPPEQIVVSLPANLVRQRPDVRSAERTLAAQTAQIGVATADLYPRFSLLGNFAFSATDAAALFTTGRTSYGFGPTFSWNLFSGGRVRNAIRVEDARAAAALAAYEQTVLLGLEEVENSLIGFVRETERSAALQRSVTAAEQSVELVKTLYRTGLTNFQNVLDMERSLARQQDSLAESEGLVVQNLIAVYRSLGGGWDPAIESDDLIGPASGAPQGTP